MGQSKWGYRLDGHAWANMSSEYHEYEYSINNNQITFENILVTVPEHSEIGIWTLDSFSIQDAVGNTHITVLMN